MGLDKEKEKMVNYFAINNLSLNKILNGLFNKKIKRITYLGNNELRKMPEYKFNLLKFNLVLDDYSNYSVFIRLVNENKIEENLFCYWFFCEENYSYNTKFNAPKANIINYEKRNYDIKYKVQLLSEDKDIYKCTFVDFINLSRYKRENIKNIKRNSLDKSNKFLFVAIL